MIRIGAILPELKTRVKVTTDTSAIDKAISLCDDNLSEVKDILNDIKSTIEEGAEGVADKASEGLKSYQELWIIQNKTIDTGQMIDTLFIEPSGQNKYGVGPTALSEYGFPYPLVIEMGSVKYEGKPFVKPALDNMVSDIEQYVQVEIINKL